ncbi:hypothetical protein CHH28_11010 [Bacterioplanes sanyensis]|uniref:Uncharacterized protein n=1 Tax=Bacterioplanes sanyensis TaxID=1249553 RepID=A0A222FKX8_9GAMM|nr:hypothetical protein CHH28_11010 [Bacterioplanes sanyensis]
MLWSRSFKQFAYGMATILFLVSVAIFFSDPSAPGTTLNLGGLQQSEASLLLSGIGIALILMYHFFSHIMRRLSAVKKMDGDW